MHPERNSTAMRKGKWTRVAAVLPLLMVLFISQAKSRDNPGGQWEVGGQITTIRFHAPSEKPLGFGGRVGRDLGRHFGLEAEANYFPQNPSTNFGETQVAAGVKAGVHLGRWGLSLKVRPGLIHFGGDFARRNPAITNRFALDSGGVAEFNLRPWLGLRIDFGDTMVFYGNKLISNGVNSFLPGTDHNIQTSIGLFFRF
jgi:hypothetical protein